MARLASAAPVRHAGRRGCGGSESESSEGTMIDWDLSTSHTTDDVDWPKPDLSAVEISPVESVRIRLPAGRRFAGGRELVHDVRWTAGEISSAACRSTPTPARGIRPTSSPGAGLTNGTCRASPSTSGARARGRRRCSARLAKASGSATPGRSPRSRSATPSRTSVPRWSLCSSTGRTEPRRASPRPARARAGTRGRAAGPA
jgi:hypothetical protein